MRLVRGSTEPSRGEEGDIRRASDDGSHRHHGFIGTNMFMPELLKLPNWEEHVRLTVAWIRGETVLPEIADLWPEGPVASLQIVAPKVVDPGTELKLRAVVSNRKAGHNFTTGPLDFTRAWIHLTVRDAEGETLAEWGNVDPETRWICDTPGVPHRLGNARDEGTMVLEAQPLDGEGNALVEHQLWRKAGGEGQRVIFPRYSDNHVFRVQIPVDVSGPLVVHAELNFRRYRQEFLDLVVPTMERDAGVYQPTIAHTAVTKRIETAPTHPPGGVRR